MTFVGVELGGRLGRQVELGLDLQGNLEGESFRLFALRVGVRASLLPGDVTPYAAVQAGGLVSVGGDGGDGVAVWTVGAGVRGTLRPSHVLLDLGVGKVGAFEESGTFTQLALSCGKAF